MTGQELKHYANIALDERSQRTRGRDMTDQERQAWWCSPQGGVDDPYLQVITGTDRERLAVLRAAARWTP